MFGPRWNKVIRELWTNRGRSLLVILSIAIGVAAIGAVMGTQASLSGSLPASYARINPASASLITDPFDEDLLDIVRDVPGVTGAEGRFLLNVRLQTGAQQWQSLRLSVYPNYSSIQVNKINPVSGAWPPADRQILIERGSLALTGAQVGDTLQVQLPDGTVREMPIVGLVHDLTEPAGTFSNQVSGYITADTLEWLGYPIAFNEVLITTDVPHSGDPEADLQAIREVAGRVRERIEKYGLTVHWTTVQDPTQHWFLSYLTPMTSVLGALGVLALLLSGFLVINTISALISQQTRQIGMMKAVGGRIGQIRGIFTGMILIFGLLALALAVPLGYLAVRACLGVLAGFINFDPPEYQLSLPIVLTQALLSLLIPSLTALVPIQAGTRIPVLKALTYTGVSADDGFSSRLVERLSALFKGLPHPLMLSMRNTFRRKSRLALTLITLTLGSAIFIGVQNVQASLLQTLDETLRYYNFDLVVYFDRPYRADLLETNLYQISSVKKVETWGVANAHRIRTDKSESDGIMFTAPPVGTEMVRPILVEGRWLKPRDENAIVINTDLVRQEPDLKIGSQVTLEINGKETQWTVVGIVKSVLMGPWMYGNLPYFAYKLNQVGVSSAVYITLDSASPESLLTSVQQIQDHLQLEKFHVSSVSTVADLRDATILQFQVLSGFLMVMALLIALVGGLGLMGTMSLNVIERSREIGLMRAVGARDGMIQTIVITEGMFIGFLSWLCGLVLSLPITRLLNNLIGAGFLQSALSERFSLSGVILWLVIILVIAAAASMAPAHRATRYAIREVLAYE